MSNSACFRHHGELRGQLHQLQTSGHRYRVLIDIVRELELRGWLPTLQVLHKIIPALFHEVSAITKAVPGFRQ